MARNLVELFKLMALIAVIYLPYYFYGGYASLKFALFLFVVTGVYSNKDYNRQRDRLLTTAAVAVVMLTVYFLFGMPLLYGISILAGGVFAIVGLSSFLMLFNLKPGAGSQITAIVVLAPLALLVGGGMLWFGLNGFDLLPTFDVGAALRGR